jgi:putative membrane protein
MAAVPGDPGPGDWPEIVAQRLPDDARCRTSVGCDPLSGALHSRRSVMNRSLVLAALALFAPAVALAADPAPAPAAAQDSGPPPGDVLTKLHHSNKMEIEAGKLAQQKGESKAIKQFGKELVNDHTAADKKVVALAKQLKVDLPKETEPMNDGMLEKARAQTGADFDKTFASSMLDDHKKDVEETSEARDKTSNPKLKKLLTEIVPKLEKHRDTAQKLVDNGGDTKAKEPPAK